MNAITENQSSHHVRWMLRRDLDGLLKIECSRPYPWCEEDFLRCLRQRNCIGMVADKGDEKIDGFVVYTLHKNRLEMENFAVHPAVRLNKVGKIMLQKMFRKLPSHRRRWLAITIRETDSESVRFFAGNGFKAIRVIRGKYPDTGEDGYRMAIGVKAASKRIEDAHD